MIPKNIPNKIRSSKLIQYFMNLLRFQVLFVWIWFLYYSVNTIYFCRLFVMWCGPDGPPMTSNNKYGSYNYAKNSPQMCIILFNPIRSYIRFNGFRVNQILIALSQKYFLIASDIKKKIILYPILLVFITISSRSKYSTKTDIKYFL